MKRICLVLLGLAAMLCCGCSYKSYFEMTKGKFDAMEVEHFNGAGKYVAPQTLMKGFSFSAAYTNDRDIPMDVSNEEEVLTDSVVLPNSKIDFAYRHKPLLFSGEANFMYKGDIALSGVSIGFTSMPVFFVRATTGVNMRNGEGGLFAYYALGGAEGEYSGYWYHESYSDMGYYNPARRELYETNRDSKDFSSAGMGGYLSVYAGATALSSSISLNSPWSGRSEGLDLTFDFPYLIKAYVGTSIWMGDHIKVSAGVTDYLNADKLSLSFGGSIGYWL